MGLKMRKIQGLFEDFLIITFIIVGSFQILFINYSTFIDEIFLILIIIWAIVKKSINSELKINIRTCLVFFLFVGLTTINVFINKYDINSYIMDVLNYYKVIVLFEGFKLLEIDKKKEKLYLKVFFWVNMISILYGILTFLFYKTPYLIYGNKFRNGKYRIMGLASHPLRLAFICLFEVLYIIYNHKNNWKKLLLLIITIFALMLTQSRAAEMLLFICVLLYLYQHIKKRFNINSKKIMVVMSIAVILMIVGIVFYNLRDLKEYYAEDIENTIRIHSLIKSYEVFKEYPILGTGIGTFGSKNSVELNRNFVYEKFNFRPSFVELQLTTNQNVFESYFAFVIIETRFGRIIFSFIFLL